MQGRYPEVQDDPDQPEKLTSSWSGSKGQIATHFISSRLKEFGIDTGSSDAVELALLELAGVEEKPSGTCQFFDPADLEDHDLNEFEFDKQELKAVIFNSIFFLLPLSNPKSMERLQEFAQENKIELHNYNRALPKEDRESKIFIRINAEVAQEKIFPIIVEHYRIKNENGEKAKDTKKNTNSTYSWPRLFSNRAILTTALTLTVSAAAVAAKAFSNRR